MEQVYFSFQGNAGMGVLVFLGACFALVVAAILFVYLWATRRYQLARKLWLVVAVGVGLYAATLLAYSLTSHEQVANLHQEKYFCEVDCHLAYSVINVTKAKALGDPPKQSTAQGIYYVVTLKARFDENTISNRRAKDMPLTPNPRTIAIFDSDGRRYSPSLEGLRALESAAGTQVPLTQPLRPGESYTTKLVFGLPPDVTDPRLLITEAVWPTHLVIGHENSFFHKKTSFRLESQAKLKIH